jgi:quinoprotein glucose dehydrogenase
LRSIVIPQADIARGFEFATLTLTDGQTIAGQVDNETDSVILLRAADTSGGFKTIEVSKSSVRNRQSTSPMPALISLMTPAELRDLVEYLATQSQ